MKKYLRLMRIHHYIKNLLVLLPLFFSGGLFNIELLKISGLGVLSFCFISSFIYVINDIADINQDKLHPIKCKRPIASGDIEKKNAVIFSLILFIISGICNYFIYIKSGFWILILWSIYFLINLFYSFGLKKIPVIDVIILALGFLLRVLYGAVIIKVEVSCLLCFTVLAVSLYMSLGKRRNELKNQGECVRRVLRYYNYKITNFLMYIFFVLTLCFYTLWCITSVTIGNINIILYLTIPILFLILLRYSKDIDGKVDGDPVNVILKDKALIFSGIIYVLSLFFIIYAQSIL